MILNKRELIQIQVWTRHCDEAKEINQLHRNISYATLMLDRARISSSSRIGFKIDIKEWERNIITIKESIKWRTNIRLVAEHVSLGATDEIN